MSKPKTEKQTWTYGEGGITLLEYYAGQAFHGLFIGCEISQQEAVIMSFDVAEAMIKEAEKRGR